MSKAILLRLDSYIMPPDSDIEFKINFREGEGSAARVFDIAANLIKSFEGLDRVLVGSVDSRITTTLVLEDVEKSSLRVFLRNILVATDDQALKDMDWKQQVGKYLVKAKYIAIEWLDRHIDEGNPAQIEDLSSRLRDLAVETDVRHLPDYAPINLARLAQPLDEIQRTKSLFTEGESLSITLDKSEYTLNLSERWMPSDHLPAIPLEQELSNDVDMVLIIKKPDFLSKSQWQFKHGKQSLSAVIDDTEWLKEFHIGTHLMKPGDALRVRIRIESKYDVNGDLAEQKNTIIKVYNVIQASGPPTNLFDD